MQRKKTDIRKQQEDQTDLLDLIRSRYQPYWPLFVLAGLIAFAGAFVYLRYATPVYKVTAALLIKDDTKGMDGSVLSSLDIFGSGKQIDNEIEILKSKTLARQVIQHLNLYGEVVDDGKIRDVVVYHQTPVRMLFLEPDHIAPLENRKLPLKVNDATQQVSIGNITYHMGDTVQTQWGRMVFLPGNVKDDVRHNYFLHVSGDKVLTLQMIANLKVGQANKQANVISLEYNDVVPARGEAVLNELMKVYDAAAIGDKNRMSAKTMAFVEERLRIVTNELGQVEGEIEKFKTNEGLVDISEQSKMFLESVKENDTKLTEANMQLSVLNSIEDYVKGRKEDENMVPATFGLTDPVLLELVNRLSEIEMQLARLKKTTGENSPLLSSLQDQKKKLTPAILENVRSLRANLEAGKQKLMIDNVKYSSILRTVPSKERALLSISRQQVIKNNIYTFLLEKREETALQYAAAISDSRIVDAAEADSFPFSPRRSMILGLAVLGGLAVVAGFISVKDIFNREVLFRADIEKATSAPILGEIMQDDKAHPIAITDGRRTAVAEQFRALRTSLNYVGINGANKTIMITSSISGEGKSFIAINLAISLSLMKKKVVLLEFDLRKPKVSKMLNVPHTPGITNYLIDQAVIGDILKKPLEGNEYFYMLSSGVVPPNPAELILNGRLEQLLASLSATFDYIIIDTAPVGPVTDARLLAPFTDATLFVVRHQRTPKFHLKMIDEFYHSQELGKLNIVFNGIKMRGIPGYSYGYANGYGYGYGNGYGYGYTDEHQNGSIKKKGLSRLFK
ncbi:polysaccharide biosynthesis tyrosine autokinase [Chitinophaga sp. LS1]|uniref:GumC family protein n=1 Tax=Chitinophaga sp. LS1 TaxID=3051176 RepID=UPI002AAAC6F5|nr:polysaccharide biosynthesis tyrosine autokinase [Chitinophaga sp. LS1]WPV70155.1 polysaccharide biosynthesis tyrosine autokinase [Chitinophaga sp. LS1]